tara:strand:+ start:12592 stop:12732 length:141 start_codon:yes stop_codon:yes gene_type:complete
MNVIVVFARHEWQYGINTLKLLVLVVAGYQQIHVFEQSARSTGGQI